jgi:hypothetical protein
VILIALESQNFNDLFSGTDSPLSMYNNIICHDGILMCPSNSETDLLLKENECSNVFVDNVVTKIISPL